MTGAVKFQIRRDTPANLAAYTPAQGELLGDTTANQLRLGDGATAGGRVIFTASDLGAGVLSALEKTPNSQAGGVVTLVPAFYSLMARGQNLNAAGDIAFNIPLPYGTTYYRVQSLTILNASAVPSALRIGLYTGASQGGLALMAQSAVGITSISANAAGSLGLMTLSVTTAQLNAATLYLNVGTANGSALTADVQLVIEGY